MEETDVGGVMGREQHFTHSLRGGPTHAQDERGQFDGRHGEGWRPGGDLGRGSQSPLVPGGGHGRRRGRDARAVRARRDGVRRDRSEHQWHHRVRRRGDPAGSSPQRRSSSRTCGSSTTSSAVSRTARCRGAAAASPTSVRLKSSTQTCRSTSTTTPTTSSAHSFFINAFLKSRGAEPVDLDKFRTLPSSKATGAQQIGRLTNLMELTVDTTWWTRYRSSTGNPDLGDTFPPAVPGLAEGQLPGDPAKRQRPATEKPHPGDRQHCRLPLRDDRAGRHEPLPPARPASHRPGGAARPAQHRPDRGDALPDLARQGRQRAGHHRSDERPRIPRPQRKTVRR